MKIKIVAARHCDEEQVRLDPKIAASGICSKVTAVIKRRIEDEQNS